jgi:beta-glucanase (GH16 family)
MPKGWGNTWHEFAVEYDGKSSIKFALDGKVYKTVTDTSHSAHMEKTMFFDVPYYFILNTAVGGSWPKPPSAKTAFPTYHFIDYVRVVRANVSASSQGVDLVGASAPRLLPTVHSSLAMEPSAP